jgi:MFS family permease
MTQGRHLTGMRAFFVVWFGQIISLLGTAMTQFGLTIWAYQKTGQATPLVLVGFFFTFPLIAVSPFAGAIVDSWQPVICKSGTSTSPRPSRAPFRLSNGPLSRPASRRCCPRSTTGGPTA